MRYFNRLLAYETLDDRLNIFRKMILRNGASEIGRILRLLSSPSTSVPKKKEYLSM